jgi:phospholipase D1/2
MVADDSLVRIGSANLTRRSMGFDSECDLALEAPVGAGHEADVRHAIRGFRDGLVAEHLRLPLERVQTALAHGGSLVRAIERLCAGPRHGLTDLPPPRISGAEELATRSPIDPQQPEPRASVAKVLGRMLLQEGARSY